MSEKPVREKLLDLLESMCELDIRKIYCYAEVLKKIKKEE